MNVSPRLGQRLLQSLHVPQPVLAAVLLQLEVALPLAGPPQEVALPIAGPLLEFALQFDDPLEITLPLAGPPLEFEFQPLLELELPSPFIRVADGMR